MNLTAVWGRCFRIPITLKACMESATCCGMELARNAVWNHHEVMHGINPKVPGDTRYCMMPYRAGRRFHATGFAR